MSHADNFYNSKVDEVLGEVMDIKTGEFNPKDFDRVMSEKIDDHMNKLKQKLDTAIKALEFYADNADVFEGFRESDDYSYVISGNIEVEVLGKRARQALKEIKGDVDKK